ncbi:MAG: hypothetical protein AAF439_16390 [Pseudomonadota bacterium]
MTEISPVLSEQLKLLDKEIDTINETIRQMDEISKSMKEWCIGVWTGAIAGAFYLEGNDLVSIEGLATFTFVIPLLFWIADTSHRVVQRKFIWRSERITEWLGENGMQNSIAKGEMVGLHLFDLNSRQTRSGNLAYKRFTATRRVMMFRTMYTFYGGLIACSLALGVWSLWPIVETG